MASRISGCTFAEEKNEDDENVEEDEGNYEAARKVNGSASYPDDNKTRHPGHSRDIGSALVSEATDEKSRKLNQTSSNETRLPPRKILRSSEKMSIKLNAIDSDSREFELQKESA